MTLSSFSRSWTISVFHIWKSSHLKILAKLTYLEMEIVITSMDMYSQESYQTCVNKLIFWSACSRSLWPKFSHSIIIQKVEKKCCICKASQNLWTFCHWQECHFFIYSHNHSCWLIVNVVLLPVYYIGNDLWLLHDLVPIMCNYDMTLCNHNVTLLHK